MNNQITFDTVLLHLIKQGRLSVDNKGGCKYKNGNGDRCAAGCLIPDYLYNRGMEGLACGNDKVRFALEDRHDIRLVKTLQNFHDFWEETFIDLDRGMRAIAGHYNLEYDSVRARELWDIARRNDG